MLVGAVLLGLQTQWGATTAARWAASYGNPLSNTQITIDGASGTWLRSLQLTGVTLTRHDSTENASVRMARIDTVEARYRLLPLLQGHLHVTALRVAQPELTLRQAADSTWDWARVLPEPEEADTSEGISLQIDRAQIDRGRFAAAFHAEGRDSTARVHDLRLYASDVRRASALTGRLDTLGLRGELPGEGSGLQLSARGMLSTMSLTVDTLQMDSPRSRVRANGHVRWAAGTREDLEEIGGHLTADPFVMADLTSFVPALDLDPQETLTLDVEVAGTGNGLVTTANAQFQRGGTIQLSAEAPLATTAPADAPPLEYTLDARIRNLTSSLLGPRDSSQNRVNATVAVDLSGHSRSMLDGTADLRLTDTRWQTFRTPELVFTSTLRDGEASLDLRGRLNETDLQASGRTRPFDEAPSATATARMQDLNVASFVPDAGIESALTASADIRARALRTDDVEADLTVRLEPSRIGVQRIQEGRGDLRLRPDRAEVSAGLALPTGTLQASAFAALDGTEVFALERLQFEDLNLAGLMGDSTANRLSGTAQLKGKGFSPETMQLEGGLTIRDAFYGPHQIPSLTTQGTLGEGRFQSSTEATVNGGNWTLGLEGRPFAAQPALEVTRGWFQNVDLGPFLQDTAQTSDFNGTFRGTVEGMDPASMTVEAGLTVDSSRINRQSIERASLGLHLRDGRLRTEFSLETPDGATQVVASARPFDRVPTYRLTRGSFDRINVGALAGLPGVATRLSGSMQLEGRGATAASTVLDGHLSLTDSQINDAALPAGQLSLSAGNGQVRTDGAFALGGGEVEVNGRVDSLDASPAYSLEISAQSVDAGALAGMDSLTAHVGTFNWRLDGRGTEPDSITAESHLSAGSVQIEQFDVDTIYLDGSFQRGQVVLDTVGVASNAFTSRGGGVLAVTDSAANSNFSLHTSITNARPLRPILGANEFQLQKGTINTRIYGPSIPEQRFDGEVNVAGVTYNDVRLVEGEFTFRGRRGTASWIDRLELEGELGYLSLPTLSVERTRFDATYRDEQLLLSSNVRIQPSYSADLGARATATSGETTVHFTRLNLRMGPDRWSLREEARLIVDDAYRIQDFHLESGTQLIAADGAIDVDGEQNLVVTANDVRLGPLSPLANLTGLGGTFSLSLNVTGPATGPRFTGHVDLNLQSENQAVGTLRLDAVYEELALNLDARMTHTDGSVLTGEGAIPIDLRLNASTPANIEGEPVRLSASSDHFPVNWIDPFLDPESVENVQGILAADVEVGGTLDAPTFSGNASLTGGGATFPALGNRYTDARATLHLSEDQVALQDAVVRSRNGGRLRAEGTVHFPKLAVGEYDVRVNADNFLAIDTRAFRQTVIGGNMNLRGTIQRPVLGGTLQVRRADIFFNEALAESTGSVTVVPLDEEDRLTLESRFGIRLSAADTTAVNAFKNMAMNVSIQIQRNTWLRARGTPEMNVQFTGDLEVTKEHGEDDPQVFGTIQVLEERSTLRQFGREFHITEGALTFNGDPATPYLVLSAVYEKRAPGTQGTEVQITLRLEGRPDDLTPTLSSEPPMETRDILSYLATGRPANELRSGTGGGNLATQVALGQAAAFVENLGASELGLDVVRVQIRSSGASYLTVGRYFTPRFFVSLEQPVATSNLSGLQTNEYLPDLTLEYHLLDTLMLRGVSARQSLQLHLLFEYAY